MQEAFSYLNFLDRVLAFSIFSCTIFRGQKYYNMSYKGDLILALRFFLIINSIIYLFFYSALCSEIKYTIYNESLNDEGAEIVFHLRGTPNLPKNGENIYPNEVFKKCKVPNIRNSSSYTLYHQLNDLQLGIYYLTGTQKAHFIAGKMSPEGYYIDKIFINPALAKKAKLDISSSGEIYITLHKPLLEHPIPRKSRDSRVVALGSNMPIKHWGTPYFLCCFWGGKRPK
jgi:hypothetical protein